MKNLLRIAILCIPVLLAGCDWFEDDDDNVHIDPAPEGFSIGIIYDYDATKCACCGGYIIKIEGNTYRFFNEGVEGGEILNVIDASFPIYVYVKWSPETKDCSNRIIVDELHLAVRR